MGIEDEVGQWPAEIWGAVTAVVDERLRQISTEMFSPDGDVVQRAGRLAEAGACYAMTGGVELQVSERDGLELLQVWGDAADAPMPKSWPLVKEAWKPRGPRRNLVRAAALILAEIQRMDRLGIDQDARH